MERYNGWLLGLLLRMPGPVVAPGGEIVYERRRERPAHKTCPESIEWAFSFLGAEQILRYDDVPRDLPGDILVKPDSRGTPFPAWDRIGGPKPVVGRLKHYVLSETPFPENKPKPFSVRPPGIGQVHMAQACLSAGVVS